MALRIAVCSTQVPFEYGGAEVLANALVRELRLRGYEVDLVRIPLTWNDRDGLLKSYLACRLVNLKISEGVSIDRLIALKFPSYCVEHPYKITWLVHQLRQAYDLLGTKYSYFSTSPADQELLDLIHRMDTRGIAESRRIAAISQNVAGRLLRYNHLEAEVIYPPPSFDGQYYNDGYGDYILSVSRLNVLKRVDLLVRAMALVRTPVRCCIVGRGDQMSTLQALAKETGSAERIEFLGYVSDEELLAQYAGALAVYYAPLDEDYGLATVEAMKSGKAVLTATDSGGVLEFVEDGITGFAVSPDSPAALAERIDQLYEERDLAEKLGQTATGKVAHIDWDTTIRRLLGS